MIAREYANALKNFQLSISEGNKPGYSSLFKFGAHANLIQGDGEKPIWDGQVDYPFSSLDQAYTVSVVSTDPTDTALGDGARTVVMYGLADDWSMQSELIALNGTTPVQSTLQYRRVFRALVLTSGTNSCTEDANAGDISFTANSVLVAKILERNGQTLMAIYTVPKDYTLFITGISLGTSRDREVFLKGKIRNVPGPGESDPEQYAFSVKYEKYMNGNSVFESLNVPRKVYEKTDMAFTAIAGTALETPVTASFGGYLVQNKYLPNQT